MVVRLPLRNLAYLLVMDFVFAIQIVSGGDYSPRELTYRLKPRIQKIKSSVSRTDSLQHKGILSELLYSMQYPVDSRQLARGLFGVQGGAILEWSHSRKGSVLIIITKESQVFRWMCVYLYVHEEM